MKLRPVRLFEGLAARVAGTLALALLPIGAVAVFQAVEISRDNARGTETALLNATAEAAAGEALAVAGAAGTSGTLAAHMSGLGGAHAGCSRIFSNVISVKRQHSFAGFTDREGIVRCASADAGRDLSEGVMHPRMLMEQEQIVRANLQAPISGTSVIIAATPVFDRDTYLGFVSVSVPHRRIPELIHGVGPDEIKTAIVTFNSDGQPLSSSAGFDGIDAILPAGVGLETILSARQYTFAAKSNLGEARIFAVVPIIPGVLSALGSQPRPTMGWTGLSTVVFPALMLVAGLVVAFQSVNYLVIRNIRGLIRNMAEFSRTRRIRALRGGDSLSREIREVEAAWTDLALHLVRDEAELEDTVHEKNVLLKEVQMRVRSIASVHQAPYKSPSSGRVHADELLANVIDGIIEAGSVSDRKIEITRRYERVYLYPDQAVPFLLLASEAVTNALKYMGARPDGSAWLRISLDAVSEDRADLEIANTCGTPFFPREQVKGSGLGRSLMPGFATQVGGQLTEEETDAPYRFHLTFAPASFDPEARDASLSDINGLPVGASG